MKFFIVVGTAALLLYSCSKDAKNPIDVALASKAPEIRQVMQNVDAYEVQIALSVVDATTNQVRFKEYEFQVNDSIYFYPASTVKLPVAVLTLEQLHNNGVMNLDLSYDIEGDSIASTFRADILDIFAVSSNKAYNNLFEFLGKDAINERLLELGIQPARIAHRLSTNNAAALTTKAITFYQDFGTSFTIPSKPNDSINPLQLKRLSKGNGYIKGDSLVAEPMDFSYKNYFPVRSLHQTVKRIVFPEAFSPEQQFNLTPDLQSFLLEAMQIKPREAGYNPEEYYDSYVKFFLFGDSKEPMPSDIIIHNKVGYAYGYLTDTAYIVDTTNELAFILTATIHVNKNGIFNDDNYEYESIGIPFLAQLGREIHQELIKQQ